MMLDKLLFMLNNLLSQLIFFCVCVFLISTLISQMQWICYRRSRKLFISLAAIGTPVHEFSHLLMCKVFGYNVSEVKLFNIEETEDGICFGYIMHQKPTNIWQSFGQYFIGTAPVVMCSLGVWGALWLFLPETFSAVNLNLDFWCGLQSAGISEASLDAGVKTLYESFKEIVVGLFTSWGGLFFAVIAIALSLNMGMSITSDFAHAVRSVPLLALILVAFNGIFGLAAFDAYSSVIQVINKAGITLCFLMVLAMIVAAVTTVFIIMVNSIYVVVYFAIHPEKC